MTMTKTKTRVMLVDDHAVVRVGFRMLLSADAAIEVVAEAARERIGEWRLAHPEIAFSLDIGTLPAELGESYTLAAYRILQEAVTNALRHASANRIAIRIDSDDRALVLEVADDGRGLAQDWQRRGHFGVRGMQERARAFGGEVSIQNRDEGGTRVIARLPLE